MGYVGFNYHLWWSSVKKVLNRPSGVQMDTSHTFCNEYSDHNRMIMFSLECNAGTAYVNQDDMNNIPDI